MENWRGLASAIIARAVLDNVNARLRLMKNPNNAQAKHTLTETEGFFCSDWFKTLAAATNKTDIDRLQTWANEQIKNAIQNAGEVREGCRGANVVSFGMRTTANPKQAHIAQ